MGGWRSGTAFRFGRAPQESGILGRELAKLTPAALLDLVRSKDRSNRLKMLMAEVFSRPDMLGGLTESDEDGRDTTLLIGDRNKAALKILEREVAGGRSSSSSPRSSASCRSIVSRRLCRSRASSSRRGRSPYSTPAKHACSE